MKLLTLIFVSLLSLAAFASAPNRPVMVEHDGIRARCSTGYAIAPTELYEYGSRTSFLHPGAPLEVCDSQRTSTGLYYGVVVGHHCQLNSAPIGKAPYQGHCPSGWARAEFIQTY